MQFYLLVTEPNIFCKWICKVTSGVYFYKIVSAVYYNVMTNIQFINQKKQAFFSLNTKITNFLS